MTPAQAKDILAARRAELIAQIAEIEDQLDDPVPQDWEDAAQERQDDEVLSALGNADQTEIRRIDAALNRIDEGEYGFCVQCGAEVAAERLELLPDTPFCANCAR
ncbi:MAG: TraR/DksA C4-type zinc finger protein [Paracoccus sp. (in: a-proteobacteria)]|uniref:TraR/DksA family transcriptional regulator n=1 Tax=Paracoccus sp. TaxID=267 RepID=UPI0026DF6886|nr:TraR/DksA C4-type zinc finger protein [Paracoccus sp. (in: a-proteobacteria)]MDO5622194.1 TraR/DksA C4-type zinc finger protein [Paracoccus sp. (in: a-proteobacteria)]